jgi:hypothetical protein
LTPVSGSSNSSVAVPVSCPWPASTSSHPLTQVLKGRLDHGGVDRCVGDFERPCSDGQRALHGGFGIVGRGDDAQQVDIAAGEVGDADQSTADGDAAGREFGDLGGHGWCLSEWWRPAWMSGSRLCPPFQRPRNCRRASNFAGL